MGESLQGGTEPKEFSFAIKKFKSFILKAGWKCVLSFFSKKEDKFINEFH